MRGNVFECNRHDCQKNPGHDCPHCGMPDIRPDVSCILNLYEKCRANNVLPYAGGVLDQPAWIMDLFNIIDEVKAAHRKSQEQTARAEEELRGRSQS